VATVCVATTLALLVYIFFQLGINSDNLSLVSDSLESRRNHAEFAALFPNLEEAMLIVIDGETPALARDATNALASALAEQTESFKRIYVPGGGAFFEDHALLYRSPEELDRFGDQLAILQPVIATLEADPSLVQLAELVRMGLESGEQEGIDATQWRGLIDRVGEATVSVYEEHPVRISWDTIMLEGSDLEIPTKRLIILEPYLDYERILVAGRTMGEIADTVETLGLTPESGVRVRVTGNPALNHEEMLGLAWDIGGAGVFCFLLVAGILQLAFRSWQLVVAALGTLLIGLVWTGAFAAATIGELNLISIAFAILFIGLGVDFAIHLGMAFAAERRAGDLPSEEALDQAIDSIGSSLVLCGFTTAIGFLVFWPTQYRGVAELGAIAGAGMFIILFLTLTFFPALLGGWLRIPDEIALPAPSRVDEGIAMRLAQWPRAICAIALLAALGSIPLLFGLRFDAHVIEMRDPDTDSVQAFRELLGDSQMSPWYVNVMAPDLESARSLARELEALPTVGRTIHLSSYVPEDQEEKQEILADLAFLLEKAPAAPGSTLPKHDTSAQIQALQELTSFLAASKRPSGDSALAASLDALESRLGVFLERVEQDDDPSAALGEFEAILLDEFPPEIARLRASLDVADITLEDLPEELSRRLLAADGTARIQVFPEEELQDFETMKNFVDEVVGAAPKAAGIAVNLIEFGEVTAQSFRQALTSAAIAICALLFFLWRRPLDVMLVLAPLSLGSLLTCASMAILDMPFNFANVLVLPLLFGIGVDSGIHLVHRARMSGRDSFEHLVESATAGAVFFSAMTTTLSFGTLALSGHQGMHTLGVMLTIGMFWTVVANLIVLPALLTIAGVSGSTE
jgi:hopanoid biosynthesis associated RND transporter like protein HpnN